MTEVENLPLAGIRVLDLTRLLPGPLATLRLRELGAEVVKIEGPSEQGQDDGARHMLRTRDEVKRGEPGLMFRQLNAGKQLLRLDLRSDAGRDTLLATVRDAQVLVEGFRPGVMARLGLGWDVLHAANPKLVMCAISGYGQHGPWADRAGHDINYVAMAGVLEQIATIDGEIALPNFQIGDLMGGAQAAVCGVLGALLAVERGGAGRFVDISMTHEVARHNVIAGVMLDATGRTSPPARDLLTGGAPCYGVFRTADGRHLAVGALEPQFWQRLCQAIGRPAWSERHHTRGLLPGSDAALALRAELAALIASESLAHWVALLGPVDCCVTPVLRLDEARAHPIFLTD
jgi:crotonobetainyl-CoA:carnitine CoA-transferase CaiB-like acyl-CoA transferase